MDLPALVMASPVCLTEAVVELTAFLKADELFVWQKTLYERSVPKVVLRLTRADPYHVRFLPLALL